MIHSFENTVFRGANVKGATKAVIFVHGRGDDTAKMEGLATELIQDNSTALIFPLATGNTWYPKSFMAAWGDNQPFLDSALSNMGTILKHLLDNNIASENIYLVGFSQGACLALDFATRNARKWGGVIAFSGGLIGPELDLSQYKGDFENTPILMGCSDIDHHVPLTRLEESAKVLKTMGAKLDYRIYPGMDHIINEDEMNMAHEILNN